MVGKVVWYGLIGFALLLIAARVFESPQDKAAENKKQIESEEKLKAFCNAVGPSLKAAMKANIERVSADKREVFVLSAFARDTYETKESFIIAYARCIADGSSVVLRDNISGRIIMKRTPLGGVSVPD
jgi:hypothetical protein